MHEPLADGGTDPQAVDRRSRPLSRSSAAPRHRQPPQPVRRRRVRRIHPQLRHDDVRPERGRAWLFRRWRAARRGRTAPARAGFRARSRGRLQHRERLAEPRRRLGAARPHAARRPQPRHQDAAHGLPRQQPPHAGTGAQIRGRTELRFRRRGRRGRGAAADAAVGAARIRRRWPRLCHRGARRAVADCCDLSISFKFWQRRKIGKTPR